MPFVEIGYSAGVEIQERIEANPNEPLHVEFSFDENRYQMAYDNVLVYFFGFVVAPILFLTFYKCHRIGIDFKCTTKNFVVLLELPCALIMLYLLATGPFFYGTETTGWIHL